MIEFKPLTKAVWMALTGTRVPPPSQRAYLVDSVAVLLTAPQRQERIMLARCWDAANQVMLTAEYLRNALREVNRAIDTRYNPSMALTPGGILVRS